MKNNKYLIFSSLEGSIWPLVNTLRHADSLLDEGVEGFEGVAGVEVLLFSRCPVRVHAPSSTPSPAAEERGAEELDRPREREERGRHEEAGGGGEPVGSRRVRSSHVGEEPSYEQGIRFLIYSTVVLLELTLELTTLIITTNIENRRYRN